MLLFYLNSTCSFIKHRQISTESDRCKSGKETSHPVFTLSIFWTGKVLFFRRGVKLLLFIMNYYTHLSTVLSLNNWQCFVKAWAFRWIHILFILLKDDETFLCCMHASRGPDRLYMAHVDRLLPPFGYRTQIRSVPKYPVSIRQTLCLLLILFFVFFHSL